MHIENHAFPRHTTEPTAKFEHSLLMVGLYEYSCSRVRPMSLLQSRRPRQISPFMTVWKRVQP